MKLLMYLPTWDGLIPIPCILQPVCVYVGGHDEAVDVPADVGRPHPHALHPQAARALERQAALFAHHSRPRQLRAHAQHAPRRGGPRALQVALARRHEGTGVVVATACRRCCRCYSVPPVLSLQRAARVVAAVAGVVVVTACRPCCRGYSLPLMVSLLQRAARVVVATACRRCCRCRCWWRTVSW